jgi:dimethylaniline monooxygenase (N-oxide forming)
MREHGMVPGHGFARCVSSCLISMLPDGFYDRVKEGSVVFQRSKSFSFCEDGLQVLDGAGSGNKRRVVPADVVILATGFRGDQKLRDMFVSPQVKDIIAAAPLYRECVHPRVAQMAVLGYAEGLNNIYASEMAAKWVARLLDGRFRLPSVRRMEENCAEWGRYYARRSGGGGDGQSAWRPCIGAVNLWYNDELCRDMGCEHMRKKEGVPRRVVSALRGRRLRRHSVNEGEWMCLSSVAICLVRHQCLDLFSISSTSVVELKKK